MIDAKAANLESTNVKIDSKYLNEYLRINRKENSLSLSNYHLRVALKLMENKRILLRDSNDNLILVSDFKLNLDFYLQHILAEKNVKLKSKTPLSPKEISIGDWTKIFESVQRAINEIKVESLEGTEITFNLGYLRKFLRDNKEELSLSLSNTRISKGLKLMIDKGILLSVSNELLKLVSDFKMNFDYYLQIIFDQRKTDVS